MQSTPTPAPATARSTTSTTTCTYTTIPISSNDVISRSLHNLTTFISLRRPWSEFISAGAFDRPDSLSNAGDRIRKNANYFRLNYGLVVVTCVVLSLIGAPLSLILVSGVLGLWLILYFFREDPLFLWSHYVNDRIVLLGLISLSVLTFWFTGAVGNIMMGIAIGIVVSIVHGILRNADELFLNETEAASTGLIRSSNSQPRNPIR